jgi:hypothetical protein
MKRDEKGQFKKGVSGNPNGRPPKVRHIPDILEKIGAENVKVKGFEGVKLEALMRKVYAEAIAGKSWAVQFIAERTEGKVKDVVATEQEVVFIMENMPMPTDDPEDDASG